MGAGAMVPKFPAAAVADTFTKKLPPVLARSSITRFVLAPSFPVILIAPKTPDALVTPPGLVLMMLTDAAAVPTLMLSATPLARPPDGTPWMLYTSVPPPPVMLI